MGETLYRVVFRGEVMGGRGVQDVKAALAALYRAEVSRMDVLFAGRPVLIQKDVDYAAAENIRRAFARAGALCSVEPMPPAAAPAGQAPKENKSSPPEGAAEPEKGGSGVAFARPPVTISPAIGLGEVAFSPMKCPTVTGFEGGIHLNRNDIDKVYFDSLRLVSVFGVREKGRVERKVLLFLKGRRRPFVVPANSIHYMDFPGVGAGTVLTSLRKFLAYLYNHFPGLMFDRATLDFALGGEPALLEEKDETAVSTALGKVLMQREPDEAPAAAEEAPAVFEMPRAAESVPGPGMDVGITEDEYSAFVGKNSEKYLSQFRRFTMGGGGYSAGWHWPAFLLPFWWLLYRRLYGWAALAFLAGFVPVLSNVAFGLTAHYIYFRHARKKIHALKSGRGLGKALSARVFSRAGGVNGKVVYLGMGLVVLLALLGIAAKIMVPALRLREARARDEIARAELEKACNLAMKHSIRNTDVPITMRELVRLGYALPQGVSLKVLDGRWDHLAIRARHVDGTVVFTADKSCYIEGEPYLDR